MICFFENVALFSFILHFFAVPVSVSSYDQNLINRFLTQVLSKLTNEFFD